MACSLDSFTFFYLPSPQPSRKSKDGCETLNPIYFVMELGTLFFGIARSRSLYTSQNLFFSSWYQIAVKVTGPYIFLENAVNITCHFDRWWAT
jgi:hypothetical protein